MWRSYATGTGKIWERPWSAFSFAIHNYILCLYHFPQVLQMQNTLSDEVCRQNMPVLRQLRLDAVVTKQLRASHQQSWDFFAREPGIHATRWENWTCHSGMFNHIFCRARTHAHTNIHWTHETPLSEGFNKAGTNIWVLTG